MLARLQRQMQLDRAGPGCFKLQCSSCRRNPQGSLCNNHVAHYKVSNAVPQIYIQIPYTWKDDLLLLLLCQGSIRQHGAAVCIVRPLCISSWEPLPWQEFPAEGGLFQQCHLGLHWAASPAARWTSGKQPLCFFSLRVLFKSHLLWNVLQDWEIHQELVPTSGRRGAGLLFGITTFLTFRIGNRLTCSPKTRQSN